MMPPKLAYVIEFVADVPAVAFYRDILGLPLKFESPGWSQFSTDETTLALHSSSATNPPGKIEVGFGVDDLRMFHETMSRKGVRFRTLRSRRRTADCWRSSRILTARWRA